MKQSKFPPGWDENRVREVLAHYETQTEDKAVAEDEAAAEDSSQTLMEVPNELVPKVRELIARLASSAGKPVMCPERTAPQDAEGPHEE